MDWNQIMQGLRENGVVKVSFEFGEKSPIEINIDENNNIINNDQETGGLEHSDTVKKRRSKNDNPIVVQFKKNNDGWMTFDEISAACGMSKNYLLLFANNNNIQIKKVNGIRFINAIDLWVARTKFEEDIVKNDGDRKGNVKFFADLLASYLDKHR